MVSKSQYWWLRYHVNWPRLLSLDLHSRPITIWALHTPSQTVSVLIMCILVVAYSISYLKTSSICLICTSKLAPVFILAIHLTFNLTFIVLYSTQYMLRCSYFHSRIMHFIDFSCFDGDIFHVSLWGLILSTTIEDILSKLKFCYPPTLSLSEIKIIY